MVEFESIVRRTGVALFRRARTSTAMPHESVHSATSFRTAGATPPNLPRELPRIPFRVGNAALKGRSSTVVLTDDSVCHGLWG